MYWTTARIYLQRKRLRHWRQMVGGSAALAVITATAVAYTTRPHVSNAAQGSVAEHAETAAQTGPVAAGQSHSQPSSLPRSQPSRTGSRVAGATATPAAVRARLLRNPRLTLSAPARLSLSAGRVDPRLQRALESVLAAHPLTVTAFGTGRGRLFYAVSLTHVDGVPVKAQERHTVVLARQLKALPGGLRPRSVTVSRTVASPVASKNTASLLVLSYV